MDYSNSFNDQPSGDDLATFTELFAMSDDPLNVTSPNAEMTSSSGNMTSSNGNMTTSNGNMTSGDHGSTLHSSSETAQQPSYDLSKLDNATLEQLISSVCSLCSGDATVSARLHPAALNFAAQ